jgi:hypothetical protein
MELPRRGDVSQPRFPLGIFQGHQSQIARYLLYASSSAALRDIAYTTNFTRVLEPTLSWNQLPSNPFGWDFFPSLRFLAIHSRLTK